MSMTQQHNARQATYPIASIFLERWSPRAFTGESIGEETLASLFEAARWAPSAFNAQPWRFLYARRESPSWNTFLDLLAEGNRGWVQHAAALVVILSKLTFIAPGGTEAVPSPTHAFDTGAAWMALALQARHVGWDAHGMAGFDHDRALQDLHVPSGYRAEAMIAIGKQGDPSSLPEHLRKREAPNDRLPLDQILFEGAFPTQPGTIQ